MDPIKGNVEPVAPWQDKDGIWYGSITVSEWMWWDHSRQERIAFLKELCYKAGLEPPFNIVKNSHNMSYRLYGKLKDQGHPMDFAEYVKKIITRDKVVDKIGKPKTMNGIYEYTIPPVDATEITISSSSNEPFTYTPDQAYVTQTTYPYPWEPYTWQLIKQTWKVIPAPLPTQPEVKAKPVKPEAPMAEPSQERHFDLGND